MIAICHSNHTHGVERLYFQMLPETSIAWAIANGFAGRIFDDRIYLGAPKQGNMAA